MEWQDALGAGSEVGTDALVRLVAEGRLEEARALVRSRADGTSEARQHQALAEAAEAAGNVALAITEYNLCLREDRNQPPVLLRLARLRADMGDLDRAMRAYRKYLEERPEDMAVRQEAAECVSEMGRPDLAVGFLVHDATGAACEVPKASASVAIGEVRSRAARPPATDDDPSFLPSDSDCVTFATIFAGREGVHARQWASATGRTGYSPVREPFTAEVARQHLLGTYTVGIYPVRMDQTVLFAALDFDVSAAGRTSPDPGRAFADRMRRAHEAALRAVDAAASLGLSVLLEDSGHKGRHVWLLFAQPVPAAAARRLMAILIETAAVHDREVSIEAFPKQSRVAPGGLGNLIKLPLGIHRLTGRRGLLLDPATGLPLTHPFEALEACPRIPRSRVQQILEAQDDGGMPAGPPPTLRVLAGGDEEFSAKGCEAEAEDRDLAESVPAPRVHSPPDPRPPLPVAPTPAPLPEREPYDPMSDVEVLVILDRCPVLAEVVRRIGQGGVLSTDERVVLTHTFGHLTRGPEAVNHWLSRALNLDPCLLLKSRLRGHPVSCARIRARLPLVTAAVDCACTFDPGAGLYPTPLLHLGSLRATDRYGADPIQMSRLDADRMVADLVQARAQAARALELARQIEAHLKAILEAQQVDRLQVTRGTVRLVADGLVLDLSDSLSPEKGPCPSST
ncbi:MAG TPA: CRISPR-associated primase-polymerase type A1 [Myxococcota bacterium]|nr:CRISPR-associated primase-polymerase type A1 [Myxococcota bacterium]HQK52298.1 CRISPR-associated primase-polymerase type A1 [Myxococcota bacterium]